MECPTDLNPTSLSCIFDVLFRDTPFAHVFFAYAHMPICPYGQIWAYRHIGIWAYAKKIWPNGVSPKRESKIQLRDVIHRSLGHSNQKLWPKVDFGEFHHVYPLEHLKSFATIVYGSITLNFFVASSGYIESVVQDGESKF